MRIGYTFAFILTIILNSIELHSQSEYPPTTERIPGVPRGEPPSSSASRCSAEKSLPCAKPPRRGRPRSHTTRSLPSRSDPPPAFIAPPMRLPSPDGLGCGIEHLGSIRLLPLWNPYRIFELRRYTFPPNESIKILLEGTKYLPVPVQEQIVSSTYGGEVFAILYTHDAFLGMYKNFNCSMRRLKINMETRTITQMNHEEINDVPVGVRRKITMGFVIQNVNPRAEHIPQNFNSDGGI